MLRAKLIRYVIHPANQRSSGGAFARPARLPYIPGDSSPESP
jgi:hypothetical protein